MLKFGGLTFDRRFYLKHWRSYGGSKFWHISKYDVVINDVINHIFHSYGHIPIAHIHVKFNCHIWYRFRVIVKTVLIAYIWQALTTPLARLPGIAQNDHRATDFVSRSCPPNLYYENSGNKRFPVHLMRCWFWKVFCKCEMTVMLNQLLFMISMISSPLYSAWLYDQLVIGLNHQRHNANNIVVTRIIINVYIVQYSGITCPVEYFYCVSNTRLWLNTGPWSGLSMS